MSKHWRYLLAVLRHKRYVFAAGRRRGVGLWQLLVHDLSKFRPSEWGPYAEWFEGRTFVGHTWRDRVVYLKTHPDDLETRALVDARQEAFLRAFLLHLHRNPHHHQYWRLPSHGTREGRVFPMPDRYLREMLADWDGAGMAYNGREDTAAWYRAQSDIVLHADTRAEVERLLGIVS